MSRRVVRNGDPGVDVSMTPGAAEQGRRSSLLLSDVDVVCVELHTSCCASLVRTDPEL